MFDARCVCVLVCLMSACARAQDASTLQMWPLDGASETAEASGGVTWEAEGKVGGAVRLNGRDGMLTLKLGQPKVFGGGESFTIEVWVRTARRGETMQVYTTTPWCELEVRKEHGEVSFNLATPGGPSVRCTGTKRVADGKWHHLGAVRDAGTKTLRLYIDGRLDVEVEDATAGHPIHLGDGPIIGGKSNLKEMFDGLIDEVRVSSVVRAFEPMASAEPAVEALSHVLENEHTRLVFEQVGSHVHLAQLIDKHTGVQFIEQAVAQEDQKHLWQVQLREDLSSAVLDESEGTLKVAREGDGLRFDWSGLLAGAADVQVTVQLPKDSGFSHWRIRIDNRSKTHGVFIASFPVIGNLKKLANDHLAIPGGNGGGAGEGQLYSDPFKTMHARLRTYPCYHQSMQFNAYYNDQGGLYLATHDGESHLKGFLIEPTGNATKTLSYEVQNYPADAGLAGVGFDAGYASVIGPFRGDWYDASRIYRGWALGQRWARLGPTHQREDISPFIRNGAYWFMMPLNFVPLDRPHLRKKARTMPIEEVQRQARYVDVESTLQMVREAHEYFGFPMMLWSNEWFEGGGDTSPPRYVPMNDLDTFLARLAKEFPEAYYSAHIQPKRYSIQLREYDQTVEDSVEQTWNFKTHLGAVMPSETNDQHAYPCWATSFWQGYWRDKAYARAKLGLRGFHVDELGSATSFDVQCFNRAHGHSIGGGTLYADTRRKMTTNLRDSARRADPTFAIHHEVLNEIYIDVADAAEVCTMPSNVNIPMYEAVYHDYNLIMGRRIMEWTDRNLFPLGNKDGDEGIDEFVSAFAQTYIWGNQPGWTRIDIARYAPRIAGVIKRFMAARYRAMKFLNFGDMMRPLRLTEALPTVERTWRYCDTPDFVLPVVYNSVWKAADGTVGIVLTNITDKAQTISYSCDLAECGLSGPGLKLTRIDTAKPEAVGQVDGLILERSDTVGAYDVMILEVARR